MAQENRDKVVSGIFWKLAERFLAQGVSFLVSVILARLLLPENYGVVALVLVFINLANVFVVSGFSTALVQNKEATDIDFSTNFWCSLLTAFVLYIILFFAAPFISAFYDISELTLIIRVFSLRIPMSSFSSIQHAYVERNMQFKKYFYSTLFGTIVSGVTGILFAYQGAGVWALIIQYFVNTIVDMVVLFFTVPWRPKFIFSFSSANKMMRYGWKILAADLSGTFFDQLRTLIIGKVYTSADLAFYNKGNQLPGLITTNISASVMTVLFPAIANINNETERVKVLTQKSIRTMTYIVFPMLFGMACVSKSLVLLLYTEKWLSAVPYIQILSISGAISMIGNISIQTMKAVGRSDIVLKLEFVKKPFYFLFLIAGVLISPIAVAYSMLIYSIYGALTNAYYLTKIINFSLKEQIMDIRRILFMVLIMCLVIYPFNFLNWNYIIILILQILLGISIYCVMSYFLKEEAFGVIVQYLKEKLHENKKII